MATITPRKNKDGSTVYRIRASAGRKADGTSLNTLIQSEVPVIAMDRAVDEGT